MGSELLRASSLVLFLAAGGGIYTDYVRYIRGMPPHLFSSFSGGIGSSIHFHWIPLNSNYKDMNLRDIARNFSTLHKQIVHHLLEKRLSTLILRLR